MIDSIKYVGLCLAASAEMMACAPDATLSAQRQEIVLPQLAYDTMTFFNGRKRIPAFTPQRVKGSHYRHNVYTHRYTLNEIPDITVEVFLADADGDRKFTRDDVYTQAIENNNLVDRNGQTYTATAMIDKSELLIMTQFNGEQITGMQQRPHGSELYWQLVAKAASLKRPDPDKPAIRLTMPVIRDFKLPKTELH